MIKNIRLILCLMSMIWITYCDSAEQQDRSESQPVATPMVLSEDGSWGYAGPHALIADNRLFYSYLDNEGNTWVASHDSESGAISRSSIWEGNRDLHSANPLVIRPDGRIQVFLDAGAYVDHSIRWKISDRAFDVTSFGDLHTSTLEGDLIQGRQFYPAVHYPTGRMFVVINARRNDDTRKAVMWQSPDGGDTFDRYHSLWTLGENLAGNRTYTRIFLRGDDIHFVVSRVGWSEELSGHNIGRVEGIYYIRYHVPDEAFYHANGDHSFDLEDTPVYDTNLFDEVWSWSSHGNKEKRAIWSDIVADQNGRPSIALAVQEAVPRGESALHHGYVASPDEDGRWHHHKVAILARGWDNSPERKNYAIAIDPQDPETIYVSMSTNKEQDLSQVHKIRTGGDRDNPESVQTLSDEGRITTIVVPRVLDSSTQAVNVLWLEGLMEGWTRYDTRILGSMIAD